MNDARWMRLALELAELGVGDVAPNPLVGAVVVRDGRAVGRGYHRGFGGPHAEVFALDEAGDAEQFLLAVAKHPFVLGEDFAKIAADQVERCRTDGDEKAAQGLERRIGHLQCIGQIVHNLTSAG